MYRFIEKINKRDTNILLLLNKKLRCKTLDIIMPFLTYLGSVSFCIAFCFIALALPFDTIRLLGVMASIALIITSILAKTIKITVNRVRPYIKVTNLNIKKIGIDKYSFPSGHTASAFCLATITSLNFPKITIIVLLFAFCVGVSRMYLGVHYPTDVLVGMLLGIISSIIVYNLSITILAYNFISSLLNFY